MTGTIKKVFLVIGVLVLCLVVWGVFFGGALGKLWDGMAGQFNDGWKSIAGEDADDIVGEWSDGGKATVGDQKGEVDL